MPSVHPSSTLSLKQSHILFEKHLTGEERVWGDKEKKFFTKNDLIKEIGKEKGRSIWKKFKEVKEAKQFDNFEDFIEEHKTSHFLWHTQKRTLQQNFFLTIRQKKFVWPPLISFVQHKKVLTKKYFLDPPFKKMDSLKKGAFNPLKKNWPKKKKN